MNRLLIGTLVGAHVALTAVADDIGNTNSPDVDALKQQVRSLETRLNTLEQQRSNPAAQVDDLGQQVRILERKREIDQETAAAAAATAPRFNLGPGGFILTSADSNFVVNLKGLVQVDSRTFLHDGGIKGNDGLLLRRARPILQGTLYRDFDFTLVPEFGGSTVQIQDAFANYRYQPELQLQAGKFKPPIGLEQLQSDTVTLFNERSLASDLLPNRDIGIDLHGDIFGGAITYAVGVFDGAPDFSSTTTNADYEDNKALVARVFFQPWKADRDSWFQGLGFGVGGSYESDKASPAAGANTGLTPGYTTDGQQRFFTYTNGVIAAGTHWRISPQANYYHGPFCVFGEYVVSDQKVRRAANFAKLRNRAWDVSAGWVLTGEDSSYTGVTPKHPFDPRKNQWGAFQVVGRYADLDIDNKAFPLFANPATAASSAHAWSAGLNWFLNRNIRVNASYSHTIFSGGNGAAATVTKQPENVFFTRLQLAF